MGWRQPDSIELSKNTSYEKMEPLKQNEESNLIYHNHTTSIRFIIDILLHIHQHYYPNTSLLLTICHQVAVIEQFQDTLLTGDLFIITYDQLILNLRHQPLFPSKNQLLLSKPSDRCQKSRWIGSIIKEEQDHASILSLSKIVKL